MKSWLSACLLLIFVSGFPAAAFSQKADLDWNALGDEAITLLSQYVQINTTNPPGDEIKAARFLKSLFDKEGIENQIFEAAPGRASIFARLKGDGSKKAVVLLNHMDVVPVDQRYWTADPFGGVIKDGFIWGRGTLDMKGTGIVEAMSMIVLKRQNASLKGDVIFLGVADEEEGGAKGAGYMTKEHADLLKGVGVVINEGGSIFTADSGEVLFYSIDVAERSPLWLKLTATGVPGHGSLPRADSAANKLVRALERVINYKTPLKVLPDVQRYFAEIGPLLPFPNRDAFKDLGSSLQDPAFASAFTANPIFNAQVRNTISLTVITGSNKTNVISPEASAHLDIRLLPGEDPNALIADLRKVMADDSIKVDVIQTFIAGASPSQGELFRVISDLAKKRDPGVPIVPSLLYAFTDCHFFRDIGIPCYGFVPFKLSSKELAGIHGNDERVSVENVKDGSRMMYDIVNGLAIE
jgi:acetylornithine deacetylase/succinyl-diaminopimelate desuccinylase-like protein